MLFAKNAQTINIETMKREFVSLITENVLDLFADQKSFK
jgi:hypothetical protein